MEESLVVSILQVGAIIILTIGIKHFGEKFGVPSLVGYIVLGLVFQFSLSRVSASWSHDVFAFLAELGIIVLLFKVGLESNISEMIEQFGTAGEYGTAPGQFTYPTDVDVLPGGGVVVGDAYNHRIQVFENDDGFQWMLPKDITWADTTRGHFNVAAAVTVDSEGSIYVADFFNHRIQKLDSEGEFLLTFGAKGNDLGQFEHPTDFAIDGEGNIYVVDFGNDRIQKFSKN